MKHVVQGVGDFAAHYARVFKAAWSARRSLDPPRRSADELAFLPAHLELIETPLSPLPGWTMRAIVALFAIALAWACIGQLDIVAVAQGKTVAGSRTKVLQPAETAVVRRILVRDGQAVKHGQLLIELDATAAAADREKADEALTSARLAELRLSALAAALDGRGEPRLAPDPALPPARLRAEQQLASSEFQAYRAKLGSLEAAIGQRQAELRTVGAAIVPLQRNAAIAKGRAEDYAGLIEGRYVGRHEYLLREQERIAAERDLATQRSRLHETRSALAGAREQLAALIADTRRQTLDALREARERVRQFAPEVAKTGQRDRLMRLRAPVSGTVQQLAVHTVGGVVAPAQALLAVVPAEDALEVEASVLNKDIGFVRPGQTATIKIESFPYTRYGYLTGTVESVSHDAAQDEKLGLVFPARVRLSKASLSIDGVEVRLSPGMALSVEIATGKRRVIDYLLGPLRQHAGEALRER
ncbi:HlyD family type I secretion periplasmic adaptor subunit [Lysobacter enzymogenes]|uniref:HlyD family type I secretion periplasmic adaptor subunit n=1 Tax=Lysobacter enzymogenes TaxID=69 RepID=UPI001A96686F|nr:HlyD family type I secretion periplasmic adaptor subunit [Lysobacter enzymogenes]QQP97797.1 HlyD family type I secretion periplasmic adaptor subunit [Lysobacter enzymogenes]